MLGHVRHSGDQSLLKIGGQTQSCAGTHSGPCLGRTGKLALLSTWDIPKGASGRAGNVWALSPFFTDEVVLEVWGEH